jgi:hypothetical protein
LYSFNTFKIFMRKFFRLEFFSSEKICCHNMNTQSSESQYTYMLIQIQRLQYHSTHGKISIICKVVRNAKEVAVMWQQIFDYKYLTVSVIL